MERVTTLPAKHIFVFGSNEGGVHGAGAAKDAEKYFGAKRGVAFGLRGQSFAIPTKHHWRDKVGMDLVDIEDYVIKFLVYAKDNPDLTFHVTPIGCGFAGHKPEDIAPMFIGHTKNVILPPEFNACLRR